MLFLHPPRNQITETTQHYASKSSLKQYAMAWFKKSISDRMHLPYKLEYRSRFFTKTFAEKSPLELYPVTGLIFFPFLDCDVRSSTYIPARPICRLIYILAICSIKSRTWLNPSGQLFAANFERQIYIISFSYCFFTPCMQPFHLA